MADYINMVRELTKVAIDNGVSNKIIDFSYNTIEHLRNVGYNDAIYQLDQQYLVNN